MSAVNLDNYDVQVKLDFWIKIRVFDCFLYCTCWQWLFFLHNVRYHVSFWHFFHVRLFSHSNVFLFRLIFLFNLFLISTLFYLNFLLISFFFHIDFFHVNFFHNDCLSHPTFISKNHQYFDPHAHITQKLFHTNSISITQMLFHVAGTILIIIYLRIHISIDRKLNWIVPIYAPIHLYRNQIHRLSALYSFCCRIKIRCLYLSWISHAISDE